jgi:hypothetical protein
MSVWQRVVIILAIILTLGNGWRYMHAAHPPANPYATIGVHGQDPEPPARNEFLIRELVIMLIAGGAWVLFADRNVRPTT